MSGIIIFGAIAICLIFAFVIFTLLAYGTASLISKKFHGRYKVIFFFATLSLPFLYSYLGQTALSSACENSAPPQIFEIKTGVTSFFYNGDRNYDLISNEIFSSGLTFVETLGGGLAYKYITVKNGDWRDPTYSNELTSPYEVKVTQPNLVSSFLGLYSTDLIIIERRSGKVLGKLTDYLWGASTGSLRGFFMVQFFGRDYLSCGPNLRKGWVNSGIGGQRRLDEYYRRDAKFIQSVLKSN